jgi:hypothetical protein
MWKFLSGQKTTKIVNNWTTAVAMTKFLRENVEIRQLDKKAAPQLLKEVVPGQDLVSVPAWQPEP